MNDRSPSVGLFSSYRAERYMVPLREGGSLPAVMEVEGGKLFVVKFRGAGQGAGALVAELIVGTFARKLGLPVPELGLIELHPGIARTERDPEIQDILNGSVGVNVGLGYLEGAFMFDPLAVPSLDPDVAARIVWLDALTTNVDRTPRNPNLLYRSDGLWLIDHGAALYFHHNWSGLTEQQIRSPFAPIRQHILLGYLTDADLFRRVDEESTAALTEAFIEELLADIPDRLLIDAPEGTIPFFADAVAARAAYLDYFIRRLSGPRAFVDEALKAAESVRSQQPTMQGYRQ